MKLKHKIAFMKTARAFAECSDSQRLQVGAVIVKDDTCIAHGYNGLPRAIDGSLEDVEGNTRVEVRHAEKNALMRLIRMRESAVGATLFVTASPCYLCAIDIVDAGIEVVYYADEYRCDRGLNYLIENGVEVKRLNVPGKNKMSDPVNPPKRK